MFRPNLVLVHQTGNFSTVADEYQQNFQAASRCLHISKSITFLINTVCRATYGDFKADTEMCEAIMLTTELQSALHATIGEHLHRMDVLRHTPRQPKRAANLTSVPVAAETEQ